jgi:hypothetical protein
MRALNLRTLGFALCAAVTVGMASAQAEDPQPAEAGRQYVVIEQNAHIPFGRQINGYEVPDGENAVLFRVGANRWYRATVHHYCATELRFSNRIALVERGTGGSVDRFGHVRVNGQFCYFNSLDRIENPHRQTAANGS